MQVQDVPLNHTTRKVAANEATRIVLGLMESAGRQKNLETFAPVIGRWFQTLCAVDDISRGYAEMKGIITSHPDFEGHLDYLLACLETCAFSAHATRTSEHLAWQAIAEAQRHAGVALALLVHDMEESHCRVVNARKAKGAQTKKNDPLRDYVLKEATGSNTSSISAAAGLVVDALKKEHGSPAKAIKHFGAGLSKKGDDVDAEERLKKRFAKYITDDMLNSGALAKGERANPQAFKRWKNNFRLPG